jgi:hypothetical protein
MFCPHDKLSMHKTLIYVLSSGQDIHAQDIHVWENLSLGQNIHECLVHG